VKRPNILFIMSDDHAAHTISCYGSRIHRTPHLDRIAEGGVRLDHCYCTNSICTPSRATILTGQYGHVTGVREWQALDNRRPVQLQKLLQTAGYATAIFGKWHLGDSYPMRPMDQGFEEVLVHRGGGIGQSSDPPGGEGKYTHPILFHNGQEVQADGYCTDVYFDAAIEFIRSSGDAPFFVYLPTNAPHTPLHDVPPALLAKYAAMDLVPVLPPGAGDKQRDAIARVFAMIENIDQNVGRMLAALEEVAVDEDTIVVYLHDNGPQQPRFNGGLRGTKGTVWEGGIRSPLFLRWPGKIAPGLRRVGFGAHIDVAPTLLAAAGALFLATFSRSKGV